jgi:hypothetical protein
MPKSNKWIQAAQPKKGALHKQLGIPQSERIPKKTLRDIVATDVGKHSHGVKVTGLLKKRANFALNAQKRRR